MASLSSLVHELRERIAASSSTPPSNGDDDALEIRFRAVLPNLLHAYVVPSSSGTSLLLLFLALCLVHEKMKREGKRMSVRGTLNLYSAIKLIVKTEHVYRKE